MMRLRDGIAEFRDALSRAPNVWEQIDIRVLAVRVEDRFVNLMTRCELVNKENDVVSRGIGDRTIGEIACLHRFLPLTDLDFILDGLLAGEINLADNRIQYLRKESEMDQEGAVYDGSFSFHIAELRYIYGEKSQISDAGTLLLYAHGASVQNVLGQTRVAVDRIDRTLRGLPNPIDGLNALSRFVCGRSLIGMTYNTSFEVAAPISVRFDRARCMFRRGHIDVALVAPSHSLANAAGLAMTWSDARRQPVSRSFVLEHWENIDGFFHIRVEADLEEAQTVTLLVRVGQHCVDRLELEDHFRGEENIYIQAYLTCDPELRALQESLLHSKVNSAAFEYAVPRLLSLCGLHMIPLAGSKRVGDAADGIAFVPFSNIVFALECTTATIDSGGKFGKLKARAVALQEAIPTFRVVPVVATALSRDEISPGELKRAGGEGAAVLGRDDYTRLLQLAEANATPLEVAEFIESCIPAQEARLPYGR
jgi:hypothetical protein